MRRIDKTIWNRRQQFEHFKTFIGPCFVVSILLNAVAKPLFGNGQDGSANIDINGVYALEDNRYLGLFTEKHQFYYNN